MKLKWLEIENEKWKFLKKSREFSRNENLAGGCDDGDYGDDGDDGDDDDGGDGDDDDDDDGDGDGDDYGDETCFLMFFSMILIICPSSYFKC